MQELEATTDVSAPPETVWALVADPVRMAEWSGQVESVRVKGEGPVGVGTRFTNRNVDGELVWVTHGEVVRFEPGREIAFRIEENWATWATLVETAAGGTRLTQRRETPDGISPLSVEFADGIYGGVEAYSELMHAGMRQTLAAIKAAAESAPGSAG